MEIASKNRIFNRFLIEIIVKHKEKIIKKEEMQETMNNIIEDYENKTGKQITNMSVEKIGKKFKLKLEVK